MEYPTEGIVTDAAHSIKNGVTEYQAVCLLTNTRLFYKHIGNQTVNIGEFLGVVAAAKYIIENDFKPRVIYTDSAVAMTWFKNKSTASSKKNSDLQKAEVFLKLLAADIDTIEVKHWDNKRWFENPADFGNK